MPQKLKVAVKNILQRLIKLEKEVHELRIWANKEKRKIDIIAWLNEHYMPNRDFSQWVKEIHVGQEELQLVFTHRLEKGSCYIIKRHLPLEEKRHFPIIAFKHQRKSIFYVYEKESWRKIKKGEFHSILKRINIKLFHAFKEWEIEHPEMLATENRETWAKCLQRILLLKEREAGILDRLEKKIHIYLELNLKSIVEYEFVF